MTDSIREIFKCNIKKYQIKCDTVLQRQSEITREDVNNLRIRYYIIYQMYLRYGCIECGGFGCNCSVLPNKHECIEDDFHDGDSPWMVQEYQV
jgi:hypothetical protein